MNPKKSISSACSASLEDLGVIHFPFPNRPEAAIGKRHQTIGIIPYKHCWNRYFEALLSGKQYELMTVQMALHRAGRCIPACPTVKTGLSYN